MGNEVEDSNSGNIFDIRHTMSPTCECHKSFEYGGLVGMTILETFFLYRILCCCWVPGDSAPGGDSSAQTAQTAEGRCGEEHTEERRGEGGRYTPAP